MTKMWSFLSISIDVIHPVWGPFVCSQLIFGRDTEDGSDGSMGFKALLSLLQLFEKIVVQAHYNGEPGVLFLDAANRSNPVLHLYQLEATNPCGEQWLGPYENCCLGSINLAEHMGQDNTVDWKKLSTSVQLAARFLDDVVQANAYVPAVPQLREAAYRARRIGLGIMGKPIPFPGCSRLSFQVDQFL